MGTPHDPEALRFYRAAKERLMDAQRLSEAGRTTGAVYLAGYSGECMLKAALLAGVAPKLRKSLLSEFQGRRAHDIRWLRAAHRRYVGAEVPRAVVRHFAGVASWSTSLRYEPKMIGPADAGEFLESVRAVAAWFDQRM